MTTFPVRGSWGQSFAALLANPVANRRFQIALRFDSRDECPKETIVRSWAFDHRDVTGAFHPAEHALGEPTCSPACHVDRNDPVGGAVDDERGHVDPFDVGASVVTPERLGHGRSGRPAARQGVRLQEVLDDGLVRALVEADAVGQLANERVVRRQLIQS
jgi:hypothetical protein